MLQTELGGDAGAHAGEIETPELVSGDEPAGPGLAAAVGDLPVPVDADNRDLGNAEPVEGHGKLDRLDAGGQFPRHRVTLGDPERAQARRHRLRPVPETGEGDPAAGSVHEEFGMRGDRRTSRHRSEV